MVLKATSTAMTVLCMTCAIASAVIGDEQGCYTTSAYNLCYYDEASVLTCNDQPGSHRISGWVDDPTDPTGCRQIPTFDYECIGKQGRTDDIDAETVQQFEFSLVNQDGVESPDFLVSRVCYRMRYCLLSATVTGQEGGYESNRFKTIDGQPCSGGDAGTTAYFISYCESGNGAVQSVMEDSYYPPYGSCEYEEDYGSQYGSGY